MRLPILVSAAVLASSCSAVPARELPACPPAVVEAPAYTVEEAWIGTVETRVGSPHRLERSPFTGQPIPVVYNDPGRIPEAVDPGFELVLLPRVGHRRTRVAHYPRGD